MKKGCFFVALLTLFSCGGGEDVDGTEEGAHKNELVEADEDSKWTLQTDGEFCEIMIPNEMTENVELNEEATIKYAVIKEEEGTVLENYLIVIPETHEEIASYELDLEFNVTSYSELCVQNMVETMTSHEVLSGEVEVEEQNGMEGVINEILGTMVIGEEGQELEIYYMMGVYHGEDAFYQVLSWTLADQKDEFRTNMDKMVRSFKEI